MWLHEAIDEVLRDERRAMSSRELADEINRRGLYVRASDGRLVEARQVAARVRRGTYKDRYKIDTRYRISLAAEQDGDAGQREPEAETPRIVRGPHGWINWYAERIGDPRRETVHPDTVVINPIWEEFALYMDAPVDGAWLTLGPYEVLGDRKSGV